MVCCSFCWFTPVLRTYSVWEDIPLSPPPSLHRCKLPTSVSVTDVYGFTSWTHYLSSSMAASIHTFSVLLSSDLHHHLLHPLSFLSPSHRLSSFLSVSLPVLQYESAAVHSPPLICQSDVVIFHFCPCFCPFSPKTWVFSLPPICSWHCRRRWRWSC